MPLVTEIYAALDGKVEFEIIYVDDGSTDATLQRLAETRQRFPRLRFLRHRASCGQSQAIATAVRHAAAPVIAMLDGDGQNDPADIPGMLARWRAEPEATRQKLLIAGWRANRKDTSSRRWASRRPTPSALGRSRTTRPIPAAAPSCFPAPCSWTCRVSTTCIVICRH